MVVADRSGHIERFQCNQSPHRNWMGPVLQLFLMPGEATAEAAKMVAMKMAIVENIGDDWELLGLRCMNDERGCLNC